MSLLFPNILRGDSFATDYQPTGVFTFRIVNVTPVNESVFYVGGRVVEADLYRGFFIELFNSSHRVERSRIKPDETLTIRVRRSSLYKRMIATVREVE